MDRPCGSWAVRHSNSKPCVAVGAVNEGADAADAPGIDRLVKRTAQIFLLSKNNIVSGTNH